MIGEGWLDGMVRKRPRPARPAPVPVAAELEAGPPTPAIVNEPGQMPIVFWVPVVCPCGSRSVRCYKTHGRTRYHRCKDCGLKFRSVEFLPQRGT